MLPLLIIALALFRFAQAPDHRAPNPRLKPLTVDDALFTVPEVTGRMIPVPDADGDGLRDLAVVRGNSRENPERIDLVSSRHGSLIRTLWRPTRGPRKIGAWDAGGDFDGDCLPDLILGFPDEDGDSGAIELISGNGSGTKVLLQGVLPNEGFGASVAFVGDVDHDGHDDFVVGARQFETGIPFFEKPVATFHSKGNTHYITFTDGTDVYERDYRQGWMRKRSTLPGYLSLRSGFNGSEMWRVVGATHGHGFGSHARTVGDIDGDGTLDVLVQSDLKSEDPMMLLSGKTGAVIAKLASHFGLAGPIGDLDRDGVPDLFLDTQCAGSDDRVGSVQFVSGKTRKPLFELSYPDFLSPYGVTVPMGDLDGDGIVDIAIGEPNFNLTGPGDPGHVPGTEPDLHQLTLNEAIALGSNPWCAFTWESGCAFVYSGRTHEVILGVWAAPGTRRGMGLEVAPMPDVSGDGYADVIVADQGTAYVFAGPGPEPKK
jgi:hypothetical protein